MRRTDWTVAHNVLGETFGSADTHGSDRVIRAVETEQRRRV